MECIRRSILVTGSNRGIGYQIVKRLYRDMVNLPVDIYMTSRSIESGDKSIKEILSSFESESKNSSEIQARLSVLELDINSEESRKSLVQRLLIDKITVDTLVNNAGIAYYNNTLNEKIISDTMNTNYHNTRFLTEDMLKHSIIRDKGRIIFVSSSLGTFSNLNLEKKHPEFFEIISKYKNKDEFTMETLDGLVKRYEEEVRQASTYKLWGFSVYAVSKLFLTVYANVLGRRKDILDKDIQVYALCPGWCQTDMTKGRPAPLTAEEGAETPVFLVNLPPRIDSELQGEFFYKGKKSDLYSYVGSN